MSKQSFSALSLVWRGLSGHRRRLRRAVIVGGGGHGLGAAYYLARSTG
jgi:hypothetical protein